MCHRLLLLMIPWVDWSSRICPGRHFADNSLFIIVARVLHTLDIEPPLDGDGNPVRLEYRYTTDMVVS